jgi:hypothetical protein
MVRRHGPGGPAAENYLIPDAGFTALRRKWLRPCSRDAFRLSIRSGELMRIRRKPSVILADEIESGDAGLQKPRSSAWAREDAFSPHSDPHRIAL